MALHLFRGLLVLHRFHPILCAILCAGDARLRRLLRGGIARPLAYWQPTGVQLLGAPGVFLTRKRTGPGVGRRTHARISPARFACQTFPVLTSKAVSQSPAWQKVSMHFR